MKLDLLRNALSNLAGAVVPAVVALVTVPMVVKGLGEAGYGLYSLVTAIVGYFAVLDINVTAGSVKYIAQFNAGAERERISETITFGVLVYAALGLLGALVLYLGAGWFVGTLYTVPPALHDEAIVTLKLAALGFFITQLANYLQSVPQALMRFDISSRVEVLFGIFVPLLTVFVLMLGYGLVEVILVRVAASVLNCLVLWQAIANLVPDLSWRAPAGPLKRQLLHFSAYSFFSRFATLTYAHADKLIVGALAGVQALAWFSVAASLANRILSLTYRLAGVFFPAASSLAAAGQHELLNRIYLKANRYIVFINASVLVLVAVFAYPILLFWMNAEFARNGALVMAVIALSQFVDSLTNLPSLVNDGMGHPRISGMFALARAVLGTLLVWLGVSRWGIDGAAWGHLATSIVLTAGLLLVVHGRTVPTRLSDLVSHAYLPSLFGTGLVALAAALARPLAAKGPLDLLLLVLLTALLLAASGTLFVLDRNDKARAWSKLKSLLSAGGRGQRADLDGQRGLAGCPDRGAGQARGDAGQCAAGTGAPGGHHGQE
jgi:O-antigen/teichoic acid export membrane protein